MPNLSILTSLAPYHLISYGILLGSSVYQSFIAGPVAFKALPRPQFSSLQKAIFPFYFSLQSAFPVILAFTYPGNNSGLAPSTSGLQGCLEKSNRYNVLLPIVLMTAMNLTNLLVLGPATTKIMKERKHQETRDGKKSYDSPPHSKEMVRLNKAFGKMHGFSAMMNLGSLLVTVWYGMELAEGLR